MIVMEFMELGSLYSILHNETTELDGDVRYELVWISVSIAAFFLYDFLKLIQETKHEFIPFSQLTDVVSGCRFLHAAHPPIVHGDLKSMVHTKMPVLFENVLYEILLIIF